MRNKYFYLLITVLLLGVAACTKTIELDPLAQNKITSYKVVNLPDTVIYGTIDNIENSITVYVPYYYAMDVIQPSITLEDGAKLTEAALPVSISDTTETYTVNGSDGSLRTYKLFIVQQNTPGLTLNWAEEEPISYPKEYVNAIIGDFLSTSIATLKVELTSRENSNKILPNLGTVSIETYSSENGDSYLLGGMSLPVDLDSGFYNVKVNYLSHTVTMAKPLHVQYRAPEVAPSWDTKVAAQGGTITFIPSASLFISLNSVKATVQGKTYDLAIQSSTREEAVLKIPEDFPVGSLGIIPLEFQFGNWEPTISNVPLTITAK